MPRVFIIHDQPRRNKVSGEFESWRNFRPAGEFGELVTVIPSIRTSNDPNAELVKIQETLSDYREDDYLLLVGSGEFLAFAGAIAARATGGPIRWLYYDKKNDRYFPSPRIDVYSDADKPR